MAEVSDSADQINRTVSNLILELQTSQSDNVIIEGTEEGIVNQLKCSSRRGSVQKDAHDSVIEMTFAEEIEDLVFLSQEEAEIQHLINHAAFIQPFLIGEEKFCNERKKDSCKTREIEKRKEKRKKRRVGKLRKITENLDFLSIEKKEKTGLVYSRKELEALRFEGLENQKKKWIEVYCGLCHLVVKEYDSLVNSVTNHQNSADEVSFDFDPRLQFPKTSTSPVSIREDILQLPDDNSEHLLDPPDSADYLHVNDGIRNLASDAEYSPDNSSDEDYSSIQKPAFLVTGEPDFDSGPPLDGLEYLRRVRWEASQFPEVTIAKIEKGKLKNEQTLYMPQIQEILKCPDNLLPLKEWEDHFLDDFSELRLGFSHLELQGSNAKESVKFQSVVTDNFDKSASGDSASLSEASFFSSTSENSNSTSNCPTLSTILKMDPATRTLMLKRHICSVENMSTLPRSDCLWLFSLLVAVDAPLDADTSASLRSLLRKCACLRASKVQLDDDAVILNIFATISGRYFGQLGK